MTSRERAYLVTELHRLAEEANAVAAGAHEKGAHGLSSKMKGRAEAFRLAADLVERGEQS
jgi:hypothetical protein